MPTQIIIALNQCLCVLVCVSPCMYKCVCDRGDWEHMHTYKDSLLKLFSESRQLPESHWHQCHIHCVWLNLKHSNGIVDSSLLQKWPWCYPTIHGSEEINLIGGYFIIMFTKGVKTLCSWGETWYVCDCTQSNFENKWKCIMKVCICLIVIFWGECYVLYITHFM